MRGPRRPAGVVLALALALSVVGAQATQGIGYGIDARGIAELERRTESARHVPRAVADSAWLDVARFALDHAASRSGHGGTDDPHVVNALREACSHLTAADLAAAAAGRRHPIVSEAFLRALAREQSGGFVPWTSEAGAEARDALRSFGPPIGKAFLDALRKYNAPAFGAGGAERSVFAVAMLSSDGGDSSGVGAAVRAGVLAGIRHSGAPGIDRIQVTPAFAFDDNDAYTSWQLRQFVDGGAGVVVVTGGSSAWTQAAAVARELGIVAVDARSRAAVDPHQSYQWPPHIDRADHAAPKLFEYGWMGHYTSFGLQGFNGDGNRPTPQNRQVKPYILRPPEFERARRLVDVVRSRPTIKKVAIAMSTSGAGYGLAACVAKACQDLHIPFERLDYEPGRRDYAAEVARFVATGADALLLSGPGEDSAEWLTALARLRTRPLILGDRELDPSGFHPGAQAALDGAVLVDDEWLDDAASDRAALQAAADSVGFAGSGDFARGYSLGRLLALELGSGAYTPSRLLTELDSASLPDMYGGDWNYIGSRWQILAGHEITRHVPLWTVRRGALVPLELR